MKAQQFRTGPSDLTDILIGVFAGVKLLSLSHCKAMLVCVDDTNLRISCYKCYMLTDWISRYAKPPGDYLQRHSQNLSVQELSTQWLVKRNSEDAKH